MLLDSRLPFESHINKERTNPEGLVLVVEHMGLEPMTSTLPV